MFRKIVAEQQSSRLDEVKASSNTDDSSSPSQDRGAEGRERQRLREQERRRREAVSFFFLCQFIIYIFDSLILSFLIFT